LTYLFLLHNGIIHSVYLHKWYKQYGLSAIIGDVMIIIIGIIITRFCYPFLFSSFSIVLFIGLAIVIQIIHDYIFYLFFTATPHGFNKVLDLFKTYSKELGLFAILADSTMIIFACLYASYLASLSQNMNIIHLFLTFYFIPFTLHSKD